MYRTRYLPVVVAGVLLAACGSAQPTGPAPATVTVTEPPPAAVTVTEPAPAAASQPAPPVATATVAEPSPGPASEPETDSDLNEEFDMFAIALGATWADMSEADREYLCSTYDLAPDYVVGQFTGGPKYTADAGTVRDFLDEKC